MTRVPGHPALGCEQVSPSLKELPWSWGAVTESTPQGKAQSLGPGEPDTPKWRWGSLPSRSQKNLWDADAAPPRGDSFWQTRDCKRLATPHTGGGLRRGVTRRAGSLGGGRESGAHLDEVERGHRALGPQGQHEGLPGPVNVVHAQHGGPQKAGAPQPLVV